MSKMRAMLLVLTAILTAKTAFATQPSTSYSFSNMTAGYRVSGSDCAIDDFGISIVNISGGSVTVDVQFGSYDYGNTTLCCNEGYTLNVLGFAVSAPDQSSPTCPGSTSEVTDTVSITSTGAVYTFPPDDFTVSGSSYMSSYSGAYHDAWQNASWSVPWFWDSTNQVLVSPYANNWHNNSSWPDGWDTTITLTNNGSQSEWYTFGYNSNNGIDMGLASGNIPQGYDPDNSCTSHDLHSGVGRSVSNGGSSWQFSLNNTVSSSHVFDDGTYTNFADFDVEEDGWAIVFLYPVASGTSASSTVAPQSGGSATSCVP